MGNRRIQKIRPKKGDRRSSWWRGFLEINIASTCDFDKILKRNETFSSSSPFQFENVTSLKLNFNENRRISPKIFTTFPNLNRFEIRGKNIKFLNFLFLQGESFYLKNLIEFKGEHPNPGTELLLQNFPNIEKLSFVINPQLPISISYISEVLENNRTIKILELNLDDVLANNGWMNIVKIPLSEYFRNQRYEDTLNKLHKFPELEAFTISATDKRSHSHRYFKWKIIKIEHRRPLNQNQDWQMVEIRNSGDGDIEGENDSKCGERIIKTFPCQRNATFSQIFEYYLQVAQTKIDEWIENSQKAMIKNYFTRADYF